MDLIIGINKGTITNVPKDDAGQSRPVEGDITFTTDVNGIATFVTEDGGKTVQVIPVAVGTVIFTAHADADTGLAVKPINGNPITVLVHNATATHIESTEGPVIPQ